MRALLGKTKIFTAEVGRTSVKKGSYEKSVCLLNITLDGVVIKEHGWVDKHDTFKNIVKGDKIRFSARVAQYISLNENHEQMRKFKLVKIRNLKRI